MICCYFARHPYQGYQEVLKTMNASLSTATTASAQTAPSAQLTKALRTIFVIVGLAVFGAFVLLFFFTENTKDMFAWTINPSAVAAFLSAGYGSLVVAAWLGFRSQNWPQVRIVVYVLTIGVALILLSTLLHLDRFHLSRPDFVPRNIAIGWMVLYVAIPPILVVGILSQFRAGAALPSTNQPFPGWARAVFAIIALLTGLVGIGLFLAPTAVAPIWFLQLTPLLSRMTASWLLGISAAAVLVVLDNDVPRARLVAVTLISYALLQFVVLVRYAGSVNWAMPSAWGWVLLLAVMLAVNVWALRQS